MELTKVNDRTRTPQATPQMGYYDTPSLVDEGICPHILDGFNFTGSQEFDSGVPGVGTRLKVARYWRGVRCVSFRKMREK